MNKTQLVEHVALSLEMAKAQAARVVEATIKGITKGLLEDSEVSLPPLGKFLVKTRAARSGRNPQTGDALQIPETRVVSYKAGKELKDTVNGVEILEEA
ncbi:MAG: Histone-like bacterial dna-binding protein [Francisellaceae bacterium]|nr:Histone-like bacterial dna-binding protein [Francisellaceae bacterium]